MRRFSLITTLASLSLLIVSCGGSDTGNPGGPDAGGDPPMCTEEPCLDAPTRGFQVRSVGEMIAPGQDVEYCEVVQLPGTASDVYYVNRFEVKMTLYSHHLIVTAVEPGSQTDTNTTVGDKTACVGATGFDGDLLPVTGSQHPYHEETYPDGVGRVFYGGQKVIFDYHYLNTTEAPVQARAAVNFHTTDAANVQKIARDFGFYNLNINTPPGETASFTKQCTFSADVTVHKLVRHTHQWGTDFNVWYVGGPNDGQLIFTSASYEDTDHIFESPIQMAAGTGFRFECNFNNTTDAPLIFGVKATDEMCILFGTWWETGTGEAPSQDCLF